MEFIVFLNRFDIDELVLFKKIKSLGVVNSISRNEDILELSGENINVNELVKLQEIKKIVELKYDWKELKFGDLKKYCLTAVKDYKSYFIETDFLSKIPISSKSIYKHINPYLKHEGLIVNEENYEVLLFIQFKKEDGKNYYRIGISEFSMWNKSNPIDIKLNNIYVVLEEPRLVEEVSDFLRLCYVFKTNLFIITEDNSRVEKLLKKAKEITKGIDYESFVIKFIPHLSKDFIKVGFSKHSSSNEVDLVKFFKENSDEIICFVFGNDTFGLTQKTRDDLDYCFRLTPEIKKPLKANQALSYVLGLYTGIILKE